MASLQKRGKIYYIVFSKRVDGKLKQKKFSLGVTRKRQAMKKKLAFEDLYRDGDIHPFQGWSPSKHDELKAKKDNPYGTVLLEKLAKVFVENRSQANEVTKQDYRRHFRLLKKKIGGDMPVMAITEQDIRDLCFQDHLAKATQASYLRHFKVFFAWLKKKKIIKDDITKHIKPPKIPDKISQKILSREELGRVFDAFDEHVRKHEATGAITMDHQRRLWFKPLIITTYYTGMRLSEVVHLLWGDVDLRGNDPHDPHDHGFIYVTNTEYNTTKSGQERVIPIRKPLKPWLTEWHDKLGNPNKGFVFPSPTGIHGFHGMTIGNVSKTFKQFVREATNVPNTVNFHGLRHSCATDLLRKNVQIHIVQKIMGHSSVDVTQIYEHLDENDLKNALAGID